MATAKRDRQRANREVKKAEEAKAAKKATRIDRVKKAALWIGLLVIMLLVANFVFGGDQAIGV